MNVGAVGTTTTISSSTGGGAPSAGILAGYNPNNAEVVDSNVEGNVSVTSDAAINAPSGFGIWAFNFGTGDTTVTTGADSSIAASGPSETINGVTVPIGIGAYAFDGGNVSVTNDGTVTATNGVALQAQATTPAGDGSGTIIITNDGGLLGAGTAANPVVQLGTDAGAATLTNDATGEIAPALLSATGLAIAASGGPITIDNYGAIIGEVALADATFNNSGTWDVSGLSTFSSGSTINNAGTINAIGNTAITNSLVTLNLGGGATAGNLWNIDPTNSGATLTLGANLTIDQAGNAGIFSTNATTTIDNSVVSYATINASAPYTFYIQPDFFTNYGQINADASDGTLVITPTGSFTNYGTVTVSNGASAQIENGIQFGTQPEIVTNEADGVISVTGSLLTVTAGSFTNDGLLEGTDGSVLDVESSFDNDGTVNLTGSILDLAAGGSDTGAFYEGSGILEFGGTRTIDDVTLTADGTLTIDNFGTLDFVTAASAVNFADLINETSFDGLQIDDVRVTFDDTTVSGGAIVETGPDAQVNVDAGNAATFENTTLTLSNTTPGNGAVLVAGTVTFENSSVSGGLVTLNNAINVIGDANTNTTFDDVAISSSSGSTINVGTLSTYDGSTASPEAVSSFAPAALNNSGAFVGTYLDASNTLDGFVYSNGAYTIFSDAPIGTGFIPVAINDAGVWSGTLTTTTACKAASSTVRLAVTTPRSTDRPTPPPQ